MAETKSREATFSKVQLLKSKKYFGKADLLNVLLEQEKNYTIKEVDKLIDGFMKKEVK